ncbi:MAG TPA: DUF4928 family protein [Streptosporangiaceae bacterium]
MHEGDLSPEEIAELFLGDIQPWYEGKRDANGTMATNVMTVGLVMIDHMAGDFPLKEQQYLTSSQVRNLGRARIRTILVRHDEHRQFTSEAGRTSRGSVPLARELAGVLNSSLGAQPYINSTADEQEEIRYLLRAWFVARIRADYFDRRRIEADELDPNKPSRQAIAELLKAARDRGGYAAGAVAQHLVGAKLSLRFPDRDIGNESYSTADQQTDRPGDFLVGDTAIHVTMSPGDNLMSNRCRDNLQDGFRPLVLVPDDRVEAARQLAANAGIGDRVAVSSVEEFVGTNIEEIAAFAAPEIRSGLRALLQRYNQRVQAVEPDPSLQIEIPGNL